MSKDIRVLGHDSEFTIKADRQKVPPYGLFGGKPGLPGLLDRSQGPGTADITQGPAMSREQLRGAMEAGYRLALDLAGEGCRLLAAGEMGIGNTTTSSAMAAVLLDRPVEEITGRGAGIWTGMSSRRASTSQRT